jgi:VCBS repeat-containing protein
MVTIKVNSVNDRPSAVDDAYTSDGSELKVAATDGVLKNDTDVDNTSLTAKLIGGPGRGTLALNEDGSFTYKPEAGFSGKDSFTYKANDGTADSNTATVTITVKASNAAPTVKAGGPYEVKEGGSVEVKGSGDDPEGGALTYAWDLDNNDSFETSGQSATFNASNLDGPSSQTVKVQVTDDKGATATDQATVNISNVAPTVTSISAPAQALTGQAVSFEAAATDPSKADTAGLTYHWTVDGSPVDSSNGSTLKQTFSSCGDHTVSVKAEDKDHGISEPVTSGKVSVYEAHFRRPLDEGKENTVQKGRIILVKITVGCGGNALTGLKPTIKLLNGDQTQATENSSDAIETLTSTADTTGVMRPVDGGYIYNLGVPSDGAVGDKFTIRVRPFGDDRPDADMRVVLKLHK